MALAYFYVGFGEPWYRVAAAASFKTARRHMPGQMIAHLSDAVTPTLRGSGSVMRLPLDVGRDVLCGAKAQAMAYYALDAQEPVAFVDTDVMFQDSIEGYFGDYDIGLIWRPRIAQPYNAGLVFSMPTAGARSFWRRYSEVANSLPPSLQNWFADQIAFSMIVGLDAKPGDVVEAAGARVRVFDLAEVCPCVSSDEKRVEAPAVHFKGREAKAALVPYYRKYLEG